MSYVDGVLEKALKSELERMEALQTALAVDNQHLQKARAAVDAVMNNIEQVEANIVELQVAMGTYGEPITKSMAKQEKAPCLPIKKV